MNASNRRFNAVSFGFAAYLTSQVLVLLGGWVEIISGSIDEVGIIFGIPVALFSMAFWALGTIMNAVLFPFNCFFDAGIYPDLIKLGQCSTSRPLGIVNYVGFLGFFVLTFTGMFLLPNATGVPPLYRFLSLFTRDSNRVADDVRRAGSSETAAHFNPAGLASRADRKATTAYAEILDREEIKRAAAEAEKVRARLSKKEEELRRRQAEKLQAAEDLARKMEEIEKLKARLDELNRRD